LLGTASQTKNNLNLGKKKKLLVRILQEKQFRILSTDVVKVKSSHVSLALSSLVKLGNKKK